MSPHTVESWLRSIDFAERSDWPSAVLHRGREEIGPIRGLALTPMLDSLPEVKVQAPEGEGWGVFRVDGSDRPWCQLSVWVNGNRMARGHEHMPVALDDLVGRDVLDGVEVHLGSDGPVFEDPVCGAVLLWVEQVVDPSDLPFTGKVLGRISGEAADTVTSVILSPGGQSASRGPDGRFEFEAVLPGLYQATFTAGDRTLYVRSVRVYAFRDSFVELEVGGPPLQ